MGLVTPTLIPHIFLPWQAPLNNPVPLAPSQAAGELAAPPGESSGVVLMLSYPFFPPPLVVGHL